MGYNLIYIFYDFFWGKMYEYIFCFLFVIDCAYGYDYDKTFYDRTAVSDEDWVCDRELYQTNSFVLNRVGEV